MTRIAMLLAVLFVAQPVAARGMRGWSYAELTAAADLVAIVQPTATKDRKEKVPFPGMSGGVMGERRETSMTVTAVLKGKAEVGKTILLHHYADTRTGPIGNGPGTVSFDPKEKLQYLMFLKLGKDGQYVAVSGQTDPIQSVEKLQMRGR